MRARLSQDCSKDAATLTLLHDQISSKMKELDGLSLRFKEKQEKKFLTTFAHVMNRMGDDLSQAKEDLSKFNAEILKTDNCLLLAQKVQFYRTECSDMRKELVDLRSQLAAKNQALRASEEEKEQIKGSLARKVKECLRLSVQNKSIKSHFDGKPSTTLTFSRMTRALPKRKLSLTHNMTSYLRNLDSHQICAEIPTQITSPMTAGRKKRAC